MKARHFAIYELVDPITHTIYGDRAWMFFQDDTIQMLDDLWDFVKDWLGKSPTIWINDWEWGGQYQWSGLRTIYCKEGADRSIHRLADAFDLKIDGLKDYEALRKEIIFNQNHPLLRRIMRIEADTATWLHIDRANVPNRIAIVYPKGE